MSALLLSTVCPSATTWSASKWLPATFFFPPAHRRLFSSKKYSDSVLLPKTTFPQRLEGKKRREQDERIVASAEFRDLYRRQREQGTSGKEEFILHDGPPYANGPLHLGHAVNKILKDITLRWKLSHGHKVHYIPGWDCHGLPIELKAASGDSFQDKTKARQSPLSLRAACRKLAAEAAAAQKDTFLSWGVMGDWDNAYYTMSPEYLKSELRFFLHLFQKDLIFRRYMPVYWSPSSRTALAESELEYRPDHRSTAAYVRFPVLSPDRSGCDRLYLLAWTTTPWTLVANKAICYDPNSEYVVVRVGGQGSSSTGDLRSDQYIVARERLAKSPELAALLRAEEVTPLPMDTLAAMKYASPMMAPPDGQSVQGRPLLPGNHVTMDAGTGLVHTAPAHGSEDHRVGLQYGLDLGCGVDEEGRFSADDPATPDLLAGLPVLEEGNRAVLDHLARLGHLLHQDSNFVHSYPYDWRSKKPVILRSSKQWFVDTDSLRKLAVEAIQKSDPDAEPAIKIKPKSASGGFGDVLSHRPYWCISRQRVWGAPIPVFYDGRDKAMVSPETVDHYCRLVDRHGTDFWWSLDGETLLPAEIRQSLGLAPEEECRKSADTLDIWFDSGISWHSVLPAGRQADLYLEGLDQFSGWFYSSLLTGMAAGGRSPFKQVFVHGFTVDEQGRKMSKSLGNVVAPDDITKGTAESGKVVYGVDVLRWWVAAHASHSSSIQVGDSLLAQTKLEVDRIRNTFKFLLGNLQGKPAAAQPPPIRVKDMEPLDRYLLHVIGKHGRLLSDLYEEMAYSKVVLLIQQFVASDLSADYLTLIKDRLYCDPEDSHRRRSATTALYHTYNFLRAAVRPVLPVLHQELTEHHCPNLFPIESEVALGIRKVVDDAWSNLELENQVEMLSSLRDEAVEALKKDPAVQGLEGKRDLARFDLTFIVEPFSSKSSCDPETAASARKALFEFGEAGLAEFFRCAGCSIVEEEASTLPASQNSFHVKVSQAPVRLRLNFTDKKLCPRCRLHSNSEPEESDLCARCRPLIR